MTRRRRNTLDRTLRLVACTCYGEQIHVLELVQVDGERLRCTLCKQAFIAAKQGLERTTL